MTATDSRPGVPALRAGQLVALVVFAGLVTVVEAYDLVAYGTTLPALRAEWGMSTKTAGLLGGLAPVGMMIGAPLAGSLTNRFGKGPLILAGLVWFSVFTPLCALATGPEIFAALRLGAGLGLGAVLPPLYALVHEMARHRHQALTLVMAQCGFSVGGIVAAALAIWVVPNLGWQAMYLLGGLPLVTLVPWAVVAYRGLAAGLEAEPTPVDSPAAPSSAAVSDLLTPGLRRATVLLWVMSVCGLLLIFGLNTWLPAVMLKAGYPIGSALSFLAVLNVGAVAGCVVGGFVADRWNVPRSVALCFVLFAGAVATLTGVEEQWLVYPLLAIAGYGAIGAFAMVNVQVARTYLPRLRPAGLGWSLGVGRLGAVAGPSIAGLILASGSAGQSLFFFALVAVLGSFAAVVADSSAAPNQQAGVRQG